MIERVPRRSVADAAPAAIAPAHAASARPFAAAHFAAAHDVSDLSARAVLDAAPPAFTPLEAAAAAFAGACAIGLLAIGPWVMDLAFGKGFAYGRVGLAAVAVGMGFHLAAGTLNQAALASGRAAQAARAWLLAAATFVAWMALPIVDDRLARAEFGYLGAAALLCAQLVRMRGQTPQSHS